MTTKKSTSKVPTLHKMLTYRRPHNSKGETEYIKDFIMPLKPEIISDDLVPMAFIVYVGNSDIMFTSHTDTVHAPTKDTRQQVILKDGMFQKNDNQPLGADDAAGNWLMINMIEANVPGIYVFFRGEERGGIGSRWCAENRPDLFDGVKCAIAFDRKGTTSVITHQARGRGCSDEFGLSLAKVLDMKYILDTTGVFTDTMLLFDLISNCTNLSVGYYNEHTKHEQLDKNHIEKMRDQLIKADWSKLDFTPKRADPPFVYVSKASTVVDDARSYASRRLFEEEDDDISVIGPKDVADFLFENAERLPRDLQEEAYLLCQEIYKRFE